MSAEPTTNPGRPVGDVYGCGPAASVTSMIDPRLAGAATVTLVQRRAANIVCGDVIAAPAVVFHPVPTRLGGRRTWMWRAKPWRLLNNPHRWRPVTETNDLHNDPAAVAAGVPHGFRVLRVCDDHPDQGQQYKSRVIAVRDAGRE
jgi:hypothetical protein